MDYNFIEVIKAS